MRTHLKDLNNVLFEELERLQDDSLDEEGFQKEIKRASAVTDISQTIIQNGELALKAQKIAYDMGTDIVISNPLLESDE